MASAAIRSESVGKNGDARSASHPAIAIIWKMLTGCMRSRRFDDVKIA